MRFDELFGAEEAEAPEPPVAHERPVWLGLPDGELGVAVPLGVVLAETGRGAVALSHALVFSSGVSFDVVAHAGGLTPGQANRVFHEQHAGRMEAEEQLPDGFFRFGLELPDGQRVSNLGGAHRRLMRDDHPPAGPVLFQHGGGGGQSSGTSVSWNLTFWLWPLPGPGLLRFYCEWPVASIYLSHVDVESAPLLAASRDVVQLWAREEGGSSVGTVSTISRQYATSSSAGNESATEQRDGESVAVPAAQLRALEDALRSALEALRKAAR